MKIGSKVKCIVSFLEDLTEDNIYEVKDFDSNSIRLLDDVCDILWWNINHFEEVDEFDELEVNKELSHNESKCKFVKCQLKHIQGLTYGKIYEILDNDIRENFYFIKNDKSETKWYGYNRFEKNIIEKDVIEINIDSTYLISEIIDILIKNPSYKASTIENEYLDYIDIDSFGRLTDIDGDFFVLNINDKRKWTIIKPEIKKVKIIPFAEAYIAYKTQQVTSYIENVYGYENGFDMLDASEDEIMNMWTVEEVDE